MESGHTFRKENGVFPGKKDRGYIGSRSRNHKSREESGRETERVVCGVDFGVSLPPPGAGICCRVRTRRDVRHPVAFIACSSHNPDVHTTPSANGTEPVLPAGNLTRNHTSSRDHRIVPSKDLSDGCPPCHSDNPSGSAGVF